LEIQIREKLQRLTDQNQASDFQRYAKPRSPKN